MSYNFQFTVDTSPMAESIDGVSHHVDGVTTAVVAMQTAVVIAEQRAADKICTNVNKGFYTLIRSQISQKIAKLKSTADAKIMELQQQSVSLSSIKHRMEKDYMMIAHRYSNLFNSLNKSLKNRIYELDKPTTNFVSKDILSIANRVKQLSAAPAINQLESISAGQTIKTSKTKSNALRTISFMQDFIHSSEHQRSLVSIILYNKAIEKPTTINMPVILTESESMNVRQNQWNIYSPEGISKQTALETQSYFFSNINSLKWSTSTQADTNSVEQEYGKMVDKSELSERIRKQMILFMESANIQKLVSA